MSFSTQICLTSLGSVNLQDPISFYSNLDNFEIPFATASISEITETSCPYTLNNVPNGTYQIKVVSNNNYCVDLFVFCDQICSICNISLDQYFDVSPTPLKVSAGNLISNFDQSFSNICGEITDYLIAWFGPDSTTTLSFTSGKGSLFIYDYTHPLLNENAVTVFNSGLYRPVLEKFKMGDKLFSISPEEGYITINPRCLRPIIVN